MDRELMLIRQIEDLKKAFEKNRAASNFLFHSIVQVLDEQSGNNAFSEALRSKIESELAKINMGGTSVYKHAINELMQPPVRQSFAAQPEKFLK